MTQRALNLAKHEWRSGCLGRWPIHVLLLGLAMVGASPQSLTAAEGLSYDRARSVVRLELATGAAGKLHTLQLERGKSKILETAFDVGRVAVGDPGIADVVVIGPRQINIVPSKVGETNLLIWGPGERVSAAIELRVGRHHWRFGRELRRILGNKTLQLEGTRNTVVIKGTVAGPLELERTLKVTKSLMKPLGFGSVINMLHVGGHQQVMIEVIIAEMSRSTRQALGVNLAALYTRGDTTLNLFSLLSNLSVLNSGTAASPSQRVNLFGQIVNDTSRLRQLDAFIEAIDENGLLKVLAEPSLVARSGESARFLAGGEVPIPIPGGLGEIGIEYKPFGVAVTFEPTVLSNERIHMRMTTEVSAPNRALGIQIGAVQVPAFDTRQAATAVELRDGQSFGIAGLLRDNIAEDVDEIPGLGQVPILGTLFRSSAFERRETELVIIVTPHLVKPLPPGRPVLPTDHFLVPGWVDLFLRGKLQGDSPVQKDPGRTMTSGVSSNSDRPAGVPTPAADSLADLIGDDPGSRSVPVAHGFAGEIGHQLDLGRAEEELPTCSPAGC